jgi:glycine/D-amino acid oxidase-like deaminating enzyme
MDVGIVGNGILGLSTAWEVLKVLGSQDRLWIYGKGTRWQSGSAAAAAMLNSFAEVDIFAMQSTSFEERLQLSQISASLWPTFLSGFCDFSQHLKYGTFVIANARTDSLEAENFNAIVETLSRWKEPMTAVDASVIEGLRPSARSQVTAAIHLPREGFMDPIPVLEELESGLSADSRVEFRDTNVDSISVEKDGRVALSCRSFGIAGLDKVLIAAGVMTQHLVADLWDSWTLPHIFSGSGSTIRLRHDRLRQREVVRTVNRGLACGVYTAPYGDEVIVGATNRVTAQPTQASVEDVTSILLNTTEQINRDLVNAEVLSINRGARPVSADGFPVVGEICPNVYVATGTKRDGWHLAPLIAKHLASEMLESESEYDLSLFGLVGRPYRSITREQSVRQSAREYINAMYQHGYEEPRGNYPEHLLRNYELAVEALHDRLGLHESGIPSDFIGYAMRDEAHAKRLWRDK